MISFAGAQFLPVSSCVGSKVGAMKHANRILASLVTMMLAVVIPCSTGFGQAKSANPAELFDPVGFIKGFRIGMSYEEVQSLLPKTAAQDALAYITGEEAFLLGVDIAGQPTWSASFKFDTLDMPARRPEQLIEFTCSAGLSTRSESFEAIVQKVTAAFGDPVELDRSQERFQQAGWRMSGGSVLTLEYSTSTSLAANNVSVEFVIKKNRRSNQPDSKAVA
jgi:hypothetical protein